MRLVGATTTTIMTSLFALCRIAGTPLLVRGTQSRRHLWHPRAAAETCAPQRARPLATFTDPASSDEALHSAAADILRLSPGEGYDPALAERPEAATHNPVSVQLFSLLRERAGRSVQEDGLATTSTSTNTRNNHKDKDSYDKNDYRAEAGDERVGDHAPCHRPSLPEHLDHLIAAAVQYEEETATKMGREFLQHLIHLHRVCPPAAAVRAFSVYGMMLARGHHPPEPVFTLLGDICRVLNSVELQKQVIDAMARFGSPPHLRTYKPVIDLYLQQGDVLSALDSFQTGLGLIETSTDETHAIDLIDALAASIASIACSEPGRGSHRAADGQADHCARELPTSADTDQHQVVADQVIKGLFATYASLSFPVGSHLQGVLDDKVALLDGWDIARASVDNMVCSACGDMLNRIQLSGNEQAQLGSALAAYVDNSPGSGGVLKFMQSFDASSGSPDVCIDGLNVGYYGRKGGFSARPVVTMVQDIESMGLNALVFLREHAMSNADSKSRRYLEQLSARGKLYLCGNNVADDVLFLSAAIQQHPDVLLISNDKFGDHRHSILKYRGGELFDRWRRGHIVNYDIVYQRNFNGSRRRPSNERAMPAVQVKNGTVAPLSIAGEPTSNSSKRGAPHHESLPARMDFRIEDSMFPGCFSTHIVMPTTSQRGGDGSDSRTENNPVDVDAGRRWDTSGRDVVATASSHQEEQQQSSLHDATAPQAAWHEKAAFFVYKMPPLENNVVQQNETAYHVPCHDGTWRCIIPPEVHII